MHRLRIESRPSFAASSAGAALLVALALVATARAGEPVPDAAAHASPSAASNGSAPAAASAAAPGAIGVSFLEGAASVRSQGAPPRALALGDSLREGDLVATGVGARLELKFASGTIVRLSESTQVELREAPQAGGRFRARLLLGSFWAHVHKLLAGERFEVETENAVAGVRGTIFRVDDQEGALRVRVYEGVVHVEGVAAPFKSDVTRNRELRVDKAGASGGSKAFEPASDASDPFARWINDRESGSGDKGTERKERERKERLRERTPR